MKLFDFDKLIGTLTGYIETKIELLKLDIKEGVSAAITRIVLIMAMVLLGIFVTLFLFMGLAALINQEMHSAYWGYLIVAAFFGLILGVLIVSRAKVTEKIGERLKEIGKANKPD